MSKTIQNRKVNKEQVKQQKQRKAQREQKRVFSL
jgi:hypothetical protein